MWSIAKTSLSQNISYQSIWILISRYDVLLCINNYAKISTWISLTKFSRKLFMMLHCVCIFTHVTLVFSWNSISRIFYYFFLGNTSKIGIQTSPHRSSHWTCTKADKIPLVARDFGQTVTKGRSWKRCWNPPKGPSDHESCGRSMQWHDGYRKIGRIWGKNYFTGKIII